MKESSREAVLQFVEMVREAAAQQRGGSQMKGRRSHYCEVCGRVRTHTIWDRGDGWEVFRCLCGNEAWFRIE